MPITLSTVLRHPSLRAADPVVRSGEDALDRPVRWMHSSEVFDIAHLLRGGELLLTGGVVLARASAKQQRRYVRELAARQVAAVAIETGGPLPQIPPGLCDEAKRLGFPVIELRKVVPFVEVTEAINGLLVNQSVERLRLADSLSRTLSARLAEGADVQLLADELAGIVHADVTVLDPSGAVVGASAGGEDLDLAAARSDGIVTSAVAVHDISVGTLVLRPWPDSDPALVAAAADRTPVAFGLAMLRSRPPTPRERAGRELVRALLDGPADGAHLLRSARAAGLEDGVPLVGLASRAHAYSTGAGALEAALRRHGRVAASLWRDDEFDAVVCLPGDPTPARAGLIADLSSLFADDAAALIAVGPNARALGEASHSLTEAQTCLDLAPLLGYEGHVDADELAVERLTHKLGSRSALRGFVDEQIGDLVQADRRHGSALVDTLDAYLTCGCNKTATARALHLQRQSVYHRLDRIFATLGTDPTGTPALAGLFLAVRLHKMLALIPDTPHRGEP
ncbi:MAG: PucR family transcriptional regulator [Streptosporangiales bacterium]